MFCSHVRYVCLYVCMYVCTKSFLKTTTNSLCVCILANKTDSDLTFMFVTNIFQNIFLCVHHNRNLYNLWVNDNCNFFWWLSF